MQKVHFQLTCVAQKRLCLSSLISLFPLVIIPEVFAKVYTLNSAKLIVLPEN